jgi:hypothetical protein
MKKSIKFLVLALITLLNVNLFAQKTIVSTNKIGQAKDGTMCYVFREIIKFNQTNDENITAIVEEKFFTLEPVLDEAGVDTGETIVTIKEDKGQTATKFSNETVNGLFTSLGQSIEYTSSFISEFNDLQQKALLIHTKSINRYGSVEWEIYTE